jgi:hypothetical protein
VHDAKDLGRHRRREQHRLPLGRQLRQDAAHIGPEAHVEHAVRLVEDEHLDPAQVRRLALHEIEKAPGRGHEKVDAVLERLHLRLERHAAQCGGDAVARMPRDLDGERLDLLGELARRRHHEDAQDAFRRDALEGGQDEGGGLAGSRLRAAHDVAPLQHERDRLFLYWRRLLVAESGDGIDEFLRETQFRERHD